MQADMKSELPFLGVQAPVLRRVCRDAFHAHPVQDWRPAVLELWREARYREERYAALALLRRHADDADLGLVEELVVTGAWWDYVDTLAQVVGRLLRHDPEPIGAAMREWSRSANVWKRRVSIICQLGSRTETDLELLRDCIEANLGERDFFVRKAIGWALREYSKTDREWVDRFIRAHEATLSPLSRREALKWIEHEQREARG